jgi:hypothetical protein
MENNLVLKIAVGVFLGMAAWTYRSDLGTAAFYIVCAMIALYVLIYIYRAVTTPIKEALETRRIAALVSELADCGLLENSLVGAACEGLGRFYYESTRKELSDLLSTIKSKRSREEDSSSEESQVRLLLTDAIDDFKQSYGQS